MGVIQELLEHVYLPKMVKVRQRFADAALTDVSLAVTDSLCKEEAKIAWPAPGGEIAVAVGSRGIAEIHRVVKAVVDYLKGKGYRPFIVPTMGSHGGATDEGQKEVLESLGVSEKFVGAPIRSSMDVVQVGTLKNGLPVYVDRLAMAAAGIVVINRVKPHTAFRGPYESGIVKMIAIGLGKQRGAESYHKLGFGRMAEHIVDAAQVAMAKSRILCGVALLENAYDRPVEVEVLPSTEILAREPELLLRAKGYMPRIWVDEADVLVVDELGKDISGDGMDPNITGRYPTPYASGGPSITKICVLQLTERTHGNANGLGTTDFTTRRALDAVNFDKTYPNALTSTIITPVKIPMVLENDKFCIQAAVKTANVLRDEDVRVVHIHNTLAMSEIRVSESLLPVLAKQSDVEVMGAAQPWHFDNSGNLDVRTCWR
ncbi:DUF2088 domain-containing protein [Alicyclobacillaceae bacterium I2511]|nr:DUF2088 domain-containing protein [Alicyclobacillaceae bacterium I2511]